jgi:glycerol-1-phosphate dehydrogenase [NAD(P)+]
MAKWQQQMEKSYGDSAAEIIALEERSGKNDPIQALRRIDRLESNWAIIREIAEKSIPDPAVIREALFLNGGAVQPQELNISSDLVIEAVLYARELRNRYTILQLYWDLGITEDAKKIAGEVYNL